MRLRFGCLLGVDFMFLLAGMLGAGEIVVGGGRVVFALILLLHVPALVFTLPYRAR